MEVQSLIAKLFEHDILITPSQAKLLTPQHATAVDQLLDDPAAAEAYLVALEEAQSRPEQSEEEPPKPDVVYPAVQVISHYNKKPKKRTYQDFVQHFNTRFRGMERILRQRKELSAVLSIDKLGQRGREKVSIIGFVLEKRDTKNDHIILEIEDRSGSVNVLFSKNKQALHEQAQDVCLDEMVGVIGTLSDDIIFADELFIPGVPVQNELKKSPDEVYMLCISDMQFGNRKFYEKEFSTMLDWLSGNHGSEEQKRIARLTKYVIIAGDVVEGVGVYPSQEGDLSVPDIYEQYKLADEVLSRIPEDKHIVIIPGNHDIGRLSEPQPRLPSELFQKLSKRNNTLFLSNPSVVRIHQSQVFPGFTCLLYHGGSFFYYGNNIMRLFREGSMSNPCAIMQYLLNRRHLAPTHTSTLYVPDAEEDQLIIQDIPDFFITGHLHTTQSKTWNGITLLSCSCWTPMTEYQLKAGLIIDPGKFMLVNLQTRQVQAIKPEEL